MLFALLLAVTALPTPLQDLPSSPDAIETPALGEFRPPAPTRAQLGGASLLLLEDHGLPLVDGLLIFQAGSLREPAQKTGLAELFAEGLRQGGSKSFTGEELNLWLDAHAADFGIESTEDQLRIRFNCLSEDTDELLLRIGQLLTAPTFETRAIETARMQMLTAIARERDDAGALADKALDRLMFGERSPYGRKPTEMSVQSIEQADLVAFAAAHLGIDRLTLGLSGDFDSTHVQTTLGSVLSGLPELGPVAELPQPVFKPMARTKIYVIDRPGVPQTELRLGGPGLTTDAVDQPALTLWSYVVGLGGMTNRMMVRVRTELGLAYSVGAGFSPRLHRRGVFFGYCGTRNDGVGEALSEMIEVITQSAATLIPDAELEAARNRLLAGHVFQRDTAREQLERALALEFYGKPASFWETNLERLGTVDATEIQAAVRRHVPPGRFLCVAVGPADEIVPSLSSVAEVIVLGEVGKLAPAEAEVEAMLEALGGRAAWARLESVHVKQVAEIEYPSGTAEVPVEQWRSFRPLSIRLKQRTPGGATYTNVITPSEGWLKSPTGVASVPADQVAAWQELMSRWLYYNLHRLAIGDEALSSGLDENGRIHLFDSGGPVGWIELGPDQRPSAMGSETAGTEKVFRYSDWTEAGGIYFAKTYTEANQVIRVESFEPFVELAADLFTL